MNKILKLLFVVVCVLAGLASFMYLTRRNRDLLGEYYAKSSVNVEMSLDYADDIALAIETSPNPCAYWLSPTTTGDKIHNRVIMRVSVPLKRPYWKPAIQVPEANAEEALKSIDNVTYFVGNKVFYFNHDEVQKFEKKIQNGYVLFYVPGIHYSKSLVFKNWSNYYGDFNFGVEAFSMLFLYPGRYIPTWLLLILLLVLCKNSLSSCYNYLSAHRKFTARLALALIVGIAFILRVNGYVRHSGWTDEIYSATVTGNPHLPFLSTFLDNGNPPFYFMLLRWCFLLFGWSEETGTMMSVVLGTAATLSLYLLVKNFLGRKTALLAAFFVAISGFVIGYSHEMRSYILQICAAPIVALAFLNFLKKESLPSAILYIIPSACIVNAHYYGILLIMANALFYLLFHLKNKTIKCGKLMAFGVVNLVIAASFMPFFMYSMTVLGNTFSREFVPQTGHIFLFIVLALFIIASYKHRGQLLEGNTKYSLLNKKELFFAAYLCAIPLFIYVLSFSISFVKPMINFRYLWPINISFMFALGALIIHVIGKQKRTQFLLPFLMYTCAIGFNSIIPDIPSGGTEGLREARTYIALDAAAHSNQKSAMLDNIPENSRYYGFEPLPLYTKDGGFDVLYVYNDIFGMHENSMYHDMRDKNISADKILKVYFDYEYPRGDGGMIIKKYLSGQF